MCCVFGVVTVEDMVVEMLEIAVIGDGVARCGL